MIQICPISQPEVLQMLNQKHQKNAMRGHAYIENQDIQASCLYDIDAQQKVCYIHHISSDNVVMFDGLVRAVLAAAIQEGIVQARFDKAVSHQLLHKLGFVQDDTFFVNNVAKIFSKCKTG